MYRVCMLCYMQHMHCNTGIFLYNVLYLLLLIKSREDICINTVGTDTGTGTGTGTLCYLYSVIHGTSICIVLFGVYRFWQGLTWINPTRWSSDKNTTSQDSPLCTTLSRCLCLNRPNFYEQRASFCIIAV